MTIIETQNPIGKNTEGTTREYHIEGPSPETVISFWRWLVDRGVIQSFVYSIGQ